MASLPPYEELVRWTVVDTTRWLAESHLDDFKDPFKKQGVDGSKLAKLTDTDIDGFKVSSTKKRIQLKNAVSSIDRSRVNSLPRTQGMMNTFRSMPSEPAPPPRPPKRQSFPTEPAPPPPPSSRHAAYNDEDDDAYSWGDEFDYQSDPEDQDAHHKTKDYINEQQWTPQDQHANRGYDQQDTYEVPDPSDDSSDEDYVEPLSEGPPTPSRRQQPVPTPPERVAPPRPKHRSAPPPPPDDEDVYEEPEEELVVNKKEEKTRKKSRQLPPVPTVPTDDRPPLPPPSKSGGRTGGRPPPQVPQQEQELYEPMDQGELSNDYTSLEQASRGSRVPDPPKSSRPQPSERSSRPLPTVPSSTEKPERKARSKNGVPSSPKQDDLEQYEWYHKNIERPAAEARLMEKREDGMYLIRKSKRGGTEQQYTLTIYKQGRVYNLPIRKRNTDGKFALGAAKPNELDFDTVSGLVDYFKKQLIKLNPNAKNAAGSTRLVIPLSK
ncbi:lymphocyte cytosolic protein 2-like isoform X7 [Haliotis rufescens]|uniref:lymphocyte cytosolic protein 2-like isoform X7 n=1 Tax=Haliotis rufescens TaxID=6454 RepID=UPI001EAFCF1F|nr:lymphocyte cytosolic protein 2-like isoform X7 [Haliotis rufescens]